MKGNLVLPSVKRVNLSLVKVSLTGVVVGFTGCENICSLLTFSGVREHCKKDEMKSMLATMEERFKQFPLTLPYVLRSLQSKAPAHYDQVDVLSIIKYQEDDFVK